MTPASLSQSSATNRGTSGNVPNPRWGSGPVHATQGLQSSLTPTVSHLLATKQCSPPPPSTPNPTPFLIPSQCWQGLYVLQMDLEMKAGDSQGGKSFHPGILSLSQDFFHACYMPMYVQNYELLSSSKVKNKPQLFPIAVKSHKVPENTSSNFV